MASASWWRVSTRGPNSKVAREGLIIRWFENLARMKNSNSHFIQYVLYLWDLDISWMERKRVSVVVANAARQTVFMYVRTIHRYGSCKCIQTDRMYVCKYNIQVSRRRVEWSRDSITHIVPLKNCSWVRGVPTFNVPFTTLSLDFVTYSLKSFQRKTSASLFFSPYSLD